jgi:hypothetical protein
MISKCAQQKMLERPPKTKPASKRARGGAQSSRSTSQSSRGATQSSRGGARKSRGGAWGCEFVNFLHEAR